MNQTVAAESHHTAVILGNSRPSYSRRPSVVNLYTSQTIAVVIITLITCVLFTQQWPQTHVTKANNNHNKENRHAQTHTSRMTQTKCLQSLQYIDPTTHALQMIMINGFFFTGRTQSAKKNSRIGSDRPKRTQPMSATQWGRDTRKQWLVVDVRKYAGELRQTWRNVNTERNIMKCTIFVTL